MKNLGKLQVAHPVLVLAAVAIFTIIIFPGLFLMYFDTSNENFLPEDDAVVEALFIVGSEFGGFQTLTVLFIVDREESGDILDLREYSFLKKLDELSNILLELNYIDRVFSPINQIKAANSGVLPKDLLTIREIFENNPSLKEFYNSDYSIMKINLSASSFGETDVERDATYDEITAILESVELPFGVKPKLWGSIIQFRELNANLGADLSFTTMITFLAIFLLVWIFFRSIVSGALAIVPIIISIIWTVGTMGYINLPFTILTSGFIPLVMGLGIDFSIHLIHKIKHLQKIGHSIEKSIIETMEETGESIFASTITTSIGFLSLLLASLLVTQRLGMTLTLSIIYIFLGCVIIIPPILLLQERIFKTRRG